MKLQSFGRIKTDQDGSSVIHSFFSEEDRLIYKLSHYTKKCQSILRIEKNGNSCVKFQNIKTYLPPIEQLKMALKQVDELQEIIKGINRELLQ